MILCYHLKVLPPQPRIQRQIAFVTLKRINAGNVIQHAPETDDMPRGKVLAIGYLKSHLGLLQSE